VRKSGFLCLYFSINTVQLLLKFYEFLYINILDNAIHLNSWYYLLKCP